jgi:uncharacterized protein YbgA (DUF1722 family)/uncharacterized protein YbbK (DUF523 family)
MNQSKPTNRPKRDSGSIEHMPAVKVGVSGCLLGKKVRFDGGHKRNRFITDSLADCFQLVPFCPEVAIGMGIPRQPIRLVGTAQTPRAVGVRQPEMDVTSALQTYARGVAEHIQDLCGFIFKKDSPSCGMARVKIYNHSGMPERTGTGLFAREIMRADPLLPVEEEGRLNDVHLRENFVTRVCVYARWKTLITGELSKASLINFHTRHKYLLLAHNPKMYRQLGQLLSDLASQSLERIASSYIEKLMQALSKPATRRCHTNVLQHLLGYLKKDLDPTHRADLAEAIDAYRRGLYPLIVPIRLLQHHFSVYPNAYICQQTYLQPHPVGLMLRNSHGGL